MAFGIFKNKNVPVPVQQTEKLDSTGELPFGWYSRHESIIKPYESRIVDTAASLRTLKGGERILQLESLIRLYVEYKRFCYSQGECYRKYFSDMWEHCHNSRNADFEYINPYIDELRKRKGEL